MKSSDIMQIEFDFVSILLQHPELIKSTIIKSNFLEYKDLARIFEILEEIEEFDPTAYLEKGFEDMELLLNVYQSFKFIYDYQKVFKRNELKIINHYKTKLLNNLNMRLSKREIDYDVYKREFDEIIEIKPITTKEHPSTDEITHMITRKVRFIGLGKFSRLAQVLKLETDDTVTIAAPPGFGKSAFLMNVFNECLNDDRNYCQYYNLEINNEQVIKRLIAIESNEKVADVSRYSENKNENISKAISRLGSKEYYIFNDSAYWERLQAEIISHLRKDKQNIVFIDYLGLIGLKNTNYNKTNYDRVTFIMKELRKLCRSYNILLFIACQCDRNSLRNERITLHSLKDSGEIENSSTHVCLLYENKDLKADFDFLKNVIMDVAKNRNNYIYKIRMQFIGNKQRFIESTEKKDVRN